MTTTMTTTNNDDQILDEAAVSEIEARAAYVNTRFEERIILTPAERDALCATVKHLREEAKAKKTELLQLSGRGDLLAKEHVKFDSLDEVAAVRNEFDRLRNILIVDLQSQLEQLRAENERLRLALTPFTNKGQLFAYHINVQEGNYFECRFCHREAKKWNEIPHDQMLCPIAHAQIALKCSELTTALEKL